MTITQVEIQDRLIRKALSDGEFRAWLVSDPKAPILELTGEVIPDAVTVQVHEESAMSFHIVLPADGRLMEAEMAQVSGGDDPDKDISDFIFHC